MKTENEKYQEKIKTFPITFGKVFIFLFFFSALSLSLLTKKSSAEIKSLHLEDLKNQLHQSASLSEQAKINYYLGKLIEDKDEKRLYFEHGRDRSALLRKTEPRNLEALHWWVANMGGLAQIVFPLKALNFVSDIKAALVQMKSLDPDFDYAVADRALGHLYESVPSIISIGSNSKAEEHYLEALRRFPDFPGNQVYYANFLAERDCVKARQLAATVIRSVSTVLPEYLLEYPEWKVLAEETLKKTEGKCKKE